jgi:coproporphyrinogen III oxidase-like Fe-S oxidoreductase
MCRFRTDVSHLGWTTERTQAAFAVLVADGIAEVDGTVVQVTPEGQACVRNACMLIDPRMARQDQERPVFSKTI